MEKIVPRNRFGELLKSLRRRKKITLAELAAACGNDGGNLSRIERGERKAPDLPHLVAILQALGIEEGAQEWHELVGAAAKARFETLAHGGFTYLGFESPLHGLPAPDAEPHQFSLTEAAVEIGRISSSHRVKEITLKSADGSEWFFPIQAEEGELPQG
jgi:transcriptional regulator with XRE-family HTH domain